MQGHTAISLNLRRPSIKLKIVLKGKRKKAPCSRPDVQTGGMEWEAGMSIHWFTRPPLHRQTWTGTAKQSLFPLSPPRIGKDSIFRQNLDLNFGRTNKYNGSRMSIQWFTVLNRLNIIQ